MEKVEVFIPKDTGGDEHNLFVSIGGINYLLPRGKTSLVPEAVAWEIHRAQKAQEQLDSHVEALLAAK